MKIWGMVAALWLIVSPSALASLEFDAQGRVAQTGPYTGPGLTRQDLVVLAGTYVGVQAIYSFLSFHAAAGTAAVSLVSWGASRTARYRPQSVKETIHANMIANSRLPKAGSLQEILQ